MTTTLVNQPDITRRDAIKSGIGAVSFAALGTGAAVPAALSTVSVVATTTTAQAQQALASGTLTQPATGVNMHPDYARRLRRWPMSGAGRS